MALFPNQRPERSERQSWDFVRLSPGQSWRGFLAGPLVTVHCHVVGSVSKPCRRRFTHGELPCEICAEGITACYYRGYAPLWSETGSGWYTVLGERYLPRARELSHLDGVRVAKCLSRGCPVRLDRDLKAVGVLPASVSRAEQDLTPHLLTWWQDPLLIRWVQTRIPLGEPTLQSGDVVEDSTSAAGQEHAGQLAADTLSGHGAGEDVVALAGDCLPPALRERLRRSAGLPSTNGRHKNR
jgi:hypothetical protein